MSRHNEETALEAAIRMLDRDTELDFEAEEKPAKRRGRQTAEPTYVNWFSAGKVKLGKPVETPEVLRVLPKKPPGVAR